MTGGSEVDSSSQGQNYAMTTSQTEWQKITEQLGAKVPKTPVLAHPVPRSVPEGHVSGYIDLHPKKRGENVTVVTSQQHSSKELFSLFNPKLSLENKSKRYSHQQLRPVN